MHSSKSQEPGESTRALVDAWSLSPGSLRPPDEPLPSGVNQSPDPSSPVRTQVSPQGWVERSIPEFSIHLNPIGRTESFANGPNRQTPSDAADHDAPNGSPSY